MVALSFKAEFVGRVASGEKVQTIREKQRARVGDRLQLYTGMRTKACRKLVEQDPICVESRRIAMGSAGVAGLDMSGFDHTDLNAWARLDGFESYAEMWAWFYAAHKRTVFEGYLIRWRLV